MVIAIIALLAALLLPALRTAREMGRRAKCLGNTRQIGLATQMYLDDHDSAFPDYPYTTERIAKYLGFRETAGALSVRLNNTSHVFYCPSAVGKPEAINETFWEAYLGGAYLHGGGRQCYGYNARLSGRIYAMGATPVTRLHQISAPLSAVFWAADAGSWQFDDIYMGYLGPYRHGGAPANLPADLIPKPNAAGINSSFVDGHAEFVVWQKFYKWYVGPPSSPVGNPYAWF